MSLELSAEKALKLVGQWFSARPLFSTDLIIRALGAQSGDYPELPAVLMAELCQRLWMFPPSVEEADDWRDRIKTLWGHSAFWPGCARWAQGQADKRTYELPDDLVQLAHDQLEKETVNYLRGILLKWNHSDGVIAFIKKEGMVADAPPIEDALLPFKLTADIYHKKPTDFGLDDAFLAIGGRGTCGAEYLLCFPTMGRELPEWMDGKSGGLQLWFSLLAKDRLLPVKPLEIGLAGCLSQGTWSLDYHANREHIVRRKWDLFRRANVPIVVLPETRDSQGQKRNNWQFWRTNEDLRHRMDEFVEGQAQRYPDEKQITHFQNAILYGEEEIDIEEAQNKLAEMRQQIHSNPEMGHRLDVLLYACCCRLGQGQQARELEDRLRRIPPPKIKEHRINVRLSANIAGGVAKARMLKQVDEMKRVEEQGVKEMTKKTIALPGLVGDLFIDE